jgi:NodT family efflux transporter outer membrane factor (OMF) lipoprotein
MGGDARLETQTAIDTLWWKSFNDPVLDHLIEVAYLQNLPLQVAGLRIMEARAQLGIARGLQFPQQQELSIGGNALGLTDEVSRTFDLSRNVFTYQLGFDAAWELDFWGKYRRGVEAGMASFLASVSDYHGTLVSLSAEVARTYVAFRTYQVLLDEAHQNVAVQEDGFHIAESRFHNGETSELDVTQAAALLESTRASVPRLQISLQQAQNALSTLLGQTTGAVDVLLSGPRQIPQAPTKVAVSVPAEMLRRRPDIRSAELYAAAQCARIGVAKAQLFPSISLFGSVGLQAFSAGPTSHNLFSPQAFVYSVGPQIVWPFFNYGRLENNVRVEDARYQQLIVNYRDAVLRAAQEVEDALTGFIRSQDAMAFEQNSVKAAQRSVELALAEYREGAVDYQRVLDAQRSLLQQENSLAQTSSSVVTNLIAAYKALGGGWEARQGQPVIPEQTRKEMSQRTDWGNTLSETRPSGNAQNPSAGKH